MKFILVGLLVALLAIQENQAKPDVTVSSPGHTISITNSRKIVSRRYQAFHDEELTWFDASTKCRRMGGTLASVQNEDEFNELVDELQNSRYWIGINDIDTEGSYKVNGAEADFLHWHNGEPNNVEKDENCVEVRNVDLKYAMNDNSCQSKRNYVCETK